MVLGMPLRCVTCCLSVSLFGQFSLFCSRPSGLPACSVRTRETNLGNFVCDVLRTACHCDAVLMNSGTFRSDAVHSAGKLTNGDLVRPCWGMSHLV